ncbi:S8 family serine peptidase [Cohaesibacter haloalkalitolerans]|uniref:S8 family serine peptidase n=1 Tax=Cohaesibacter haloalkalitolerans TaxID=1162980 RepID=UPI0013C3E816|nr:S8 family serine peptidase [Cohaesibacter haloalkalitolerans]
MRFSIQKSAITLIVAGFLAVPVVALPGAAGAQTYTDQRYIPNYPRRGTEPHRRGSRGIGSGAAFGVGLGLGLTIIDGISRQNQMRQPPPDYAPPEAPPPRQGYRPAPRKPSQQARSPKPPRETPRIELPETLRVAAAKPRVYSIGDKPWASDTEFVVTLNPGLSESDVATFLSDYGLDLIEQTKIKLLDQYVLKLAYPEGMSVRDILQLAGDERVFRAQPDYFYYPSDDGTSVPQPPFAGLQYAFDRLGLGTGQMAEGVSGEGVRLAVIDSGVNASHPAVSGVVAAHYSAFPDAAEGELVPAHGTAIASIIAARSGMRGIADKVSLLSAEVFRADERGNMVADSYDIVGGIDWAVEQGAEILNLSFAGGRDALMEAALAKASERGVVAVAAAGNEGSEAPVAYPAAYPSVIAVTATDDADALYVFANQGDKVELAAPGVDVLVAAGDEGFALQSGTSMATAYISGSIALLLQKEPGLGLAEIKTRLSRSTEDLGPAGRDPQFGFGRLDLSKVLREGDTR